MDDHGEFDGRKLTIRPPRKRASPAIGRSREAGAGDRRETDLERIAREALAIEAERAKEAGELGYMGRLIVQATMPHKDPGAVSAFERHNGDFHLSMVAPPRIGLPWGKVPRLVLCWLTTEAVKTRSPILHLGPTLSGFMAELGQTPTGGRWGSITRLRDQVRRLFASTVRCSYEAPGRYETAGFLIAARASLWWNPAAPEQPDLFGSMVELTPDFYRSVVDRPVPVDLRVLRVLRSPLALDLYCWLSWRVSYLRQPVEIPWPALALQFGSDYEEVRMFRRAFLRQAANVMRLYPDARISEGERGLIVRPAPPHVPRLPAAR